MSSWTKPYLLSGQKLSQHDRFEQAKLILHLCASTPHQNKEKQQQQKNQCYILQHPASVIPLLKTKLTNKQKTHGQVCSLFCLLNLF